MAGMPLWELTSEYLLLESKLDDALAGDAELVELRQQGAPVAPDDPRAAGLKEALDALGGAITDKVEGVARIIRNREAGALSLADEAARLQGRADVAKHGAERLRQYLYDQLDALGEDTQRQETPVAKVVLSKRPDRKVIRIDDQAALPPQFVKATLQMTLGDVPAALMAYIKREDVVMALVKEHAEAEGLPPPGATFVAPRRSLRIS